MKKTVNNQAFHGVEEILLTQECCSKVELRLTSALDSGQYLLLIDVDLERLFKLLKKSSDIEINRALAGYTPAMRAQVEEMRKEYDQMCQFDQDPAPPPITIKETLWKNLN